MTLGQALSAADLTEPTSRPRHANKTIGGKANMNGRGFLAIWSDIDAAAETDYLHWMTREHAIERVSIPGFLGMRMFRALRGDVRRYFILYELETPDVVGGAAYLARLNSPTPWSQRIMPRLRNFVRGGGHVTAASGAGLGGFVTAQPFEDEDIAALDATALVTAVAREERISSVRLLATDSAQTAIRTHEKDMRTGDASFDGLLLIEGLDEAAVKTAAGHLTARARRHDAPAQVYVTIFALDRRLL
jgi:hypothetical protein